jgi:hypothetical protein
VLKGETRSQAFTYAVPLCTWTRKGERAGLGGARKRESVPRVARRKEAKEKKRCICIKVGAREEKLKT